MRRMFSETPLITLSAALFLAAGSSALAAPAPEAHRAVIVRVQPAYPELARRMHVGGAVILHVVILPDGTVSETRVESGHALLREAAQEAVHHWRFVPDQETSECTVSVAFQLTN